ncbi:MAG: nudix-type nucleoside diphosphatase (YffH/AdpP family) [Candidatus Endobugula sp.]|jgi:nudix-type nucleoside diphosphatase (YffH/AdpP family)
MRVKNVRRDLLSDNWYRLEKVSFDYRKKDGNWERQQREAYDRGNGAVILLFNKAKKTVILTKQFRMPTFLNGNETGMLIEACAGLLDENDTETCIRLEAQEETGYKIEKLEKVMEVYMSPGSVTEILYFFIAEYDHSMKITDGGGLAHEQEELEVLEYDFEATLAMIKFGEIKDAKTIILLYHLQVHHLI